jgi:PAS domain S-box-containing protein
MTDSKPIKIFIVEDEMLIAANLKEQLKDHGYHVVGIATRGETAMEELRIRKNNNESPDIVMMDINLKGHLDGVETAEKLNEWLDSAIIFMTGQTSKEVYERSFHIKPFGYVLKPYDLEQTIMTIEIAAYQRNLEKENKEVHIRLQDLISKTAKEKEEVSALYEAVVENTLMGVWLIQDNKALFVNKAMTNILGYSKEEIMAFGEEDFKKIVHPEDLTRLLDLSYRRLLGENLPQHTKFRIIRKSGSVLRIKSYVTIVPFKGKPAIHQTFLDITEYEETPV